MNLGLKHVLLRLLWLKHVANRACFPAAGCVPAGSPTQGVTVLLGDNFWSVGDFICCEHSSEYPSVSTSSKEPREVVESPSLKLFKRHIDKALKDVVCGWT